MAKTTAILSPTEKSWPSASCGFNGMKLQISSPGPEPESINVRDIRFKMFSYKKCSGLFDIEVYWRVHKYCRENGLRIIDIKFETWKYIQREQYLEKMHKEFSNWIDKKLSKPDNF